MADIFDFAADKLEQATDFDKLEARGTMRLSLKLAGLDAKSVSAAQLTVVVEKVLPNELESRGIENPASICDGLKNALKSFDGEAGGGNDSSPEAVFKRIGGG